MTAWLQTLTRVAGGGLERPAVLLALMFVPALAVFYAVALSARHSALKRLLGDGMAKSLVRQPSRDLRAGEAAFAAAALALTVLALAGPRWGRDHERVKRSGSDVVVVLDVSRSMLAQDVAPSRLDRARREIRGLLDASSGDRVALVTFAGDSRLACPLTLDHDTLGMFVDEADPGVDHRGGSDLAGALATAAEALDASSGAGKAVVILSDGEDFSKGGRAAVAAAAALRARGAHVHAIGLGTATGARIPVVDEKGHAHFFTDAKGVEVLTKLEPETLRAVASAGGGEYLDAASVAFPMDELAKKRISRLARSETGDDDLLSLQARFQWFLFPALLCAAIAWMLPLGGAAPARRAQPAPRAAPLPLRKAAAVLLALGVMALARNARAGAVEEGARGDGLYRKGDFEGASQSYDFATRSLPGPNGPFNLGDAKFRAGKFREAAHAFAEAEKRAADPVVRRDAAFNRGNAMLQAADADPENAAEAMKSAIDAYSGALRVDPTDADARHNRAIAIARWTEAKRKQDSPSSQQDSRKDDSKKDASKQDGSKQDGSKQDGSKQDGSKQDGSKQDASKQDASKQDASKQDGSKQDEKKDREPGDAKKDGQPLPQSAKLERIDRMLDASERQQRRIEQMKARMHRQQGEHDW